MILGFKGIVLAMVIMATTQINAENEGLNTALTTEEPQSKHESGENETIANYDEQDGRNFLSDLRIKMTGGVSPGQLRPRERKKAARWQKKQDEKIRKRENNEDDDYEDDD